MDNVCRLLALLLVCAGAARAETVTFNVTYFPGNNTVYQIVGTPQAGDVNGRNPALTVRRER